MILSEFKGLHLPLEAIQGLAADFWLEKAVPYSDGVWEEGPLIVKSSSIGYQKTHVKASHCYGWCQVAVLSTSLGKTFFACCFILDENILF